MIMMMGVIGFKQWVPSIIVEPSICYLLMKIRDISFTWSFYLREQYFSISLSSILIKFSINNRNWIWKETIQKSTKYLNCPYCMLSMMIESCPPFFTPQLKRAKSKSSFALLYWTTILPNILTREASQLTTPWL